MSVKRISAVITAVLLALFSVIICYADDGPSLVQVYSYENTMDVFISGYINTDNASVKVANREAEVVSGGSLADMGVTVRTTLLIDISTSIPTAAREYVLSYIDSYIAGLNQNEQLRIATFGEKTTILQDFTNDRYDLSVAVSDIKFDNSQSMIYDALYNTIPAITNIDGEPCYYRTIVITDGVDVTKTGITKEELLIKLQNDTYPISVIEVSKEKASSENKDLAALTRISGGAYGNIFPEFDNNALLSEFLTDGTSWLRICIPGDLLDGSTRQVNISDGTNSVQFDAKLPVFDVPDLDPEPEVTVAPEESELPTEETETAPGVVSSEATNSVLEDYGIVIIIGAAIIAIIVIALIVASIYVGKKKKRNTGAVEHTINSSNDVANKETEFLSEEAVKAAIGSTCVKLRNLSEPDQVWSFSLSDELIIGRDTSCKICIADTSISRRQCRVYNQETTYIENLSNSNITQVNGEMITAPMALNIGDKIKCGRVTLIVEQIYVADSHNIGTMNKLTEFVRL